MSPRVFSFCGAAILLAALCLAIASSAAADEAEAISDAEARLASVVLPPGAISVSGRPEGITVLSGPPETPGSPNLIDRGKWWVLAGSAAEVLEWFRANHPEGSTQRISGGLDGPGGTEFSFLGFEWPETAALSTRLLTVAAATRPEGGSALRIDAQDVWLEQHPSSEKIPKAARFLEIVWDRNKDRDSRASTSNARFIRSISDELDSLPISQPGIVYCPRMPTNPTTVTLRFRSRLGGPLLAEAKQSMPPGVCSPMTLTIHGKGQPALMGADPVIARLRKLRQR